MATNERAQNRIYRVRGAATRYSKNIEKITGNVPGMPLNDLRIGNTWA
jgi:hypothetical protein